MNRKILDIVLAVIFLTINFSQAHAAAPKAGGQVPGWFRMMLGEFEVTALNDGIMQIDPAILNNIDKADVDKLLADVFASGGVPASINTFVINTGEKLILVDTGFGRFLPNLQACGYSAEQIDLVFITHTHGDHVGGLLTAEGGATFPNAAVYLARAEQDWAKPEQIARFTAAYPGRWHTFEFGTELVPGVTALDVSGHTPGHTAFMVESQGQKLCIWGDVIHAAAVQFPHPEVTINYDSDKAKAASARKLIMAQLAAEKVWVAGMHLPLPAIGHIRAEAAGYSWVPALFSVSDSK